MYANNRFYFLQVVNTLGPWDPAVDSDRIFAGFDFTNQPRPMIVAESDLQAAYRGKRFGNAVLLIVFAVVAVLLAVYFDHWRKRKRADPDA